MKTTKEQGTLAQKETMCDCGHVAISDGCATGYGIDKEGKTHCFSCCAERDKEQMEKDGRITLYLSDSEVMNWPGTLRFKAHVQIGNHNIAGKRYDAWFTDHHGKKWHGVTYGDNTQLCHCRKLKRS